jgi:hypothetical protein
LPLNSWHHHSTGHAPHLPLLFLLPLPLLLLLILRLSFNSRSGATKQRS